MKSILCRLESCGKGQGEIVQREIMSHSYHATDFDGTGVPTLESLENMDIDVQWGAPKK
jgi:hypothetical protein